jgi:hypothetical protein
MLFFIIKSKVNHNNGQVSQQVKGYRQCNDSTTACCYVPKDELKRLLPFGRFNTKSYTISTYETTKEIIEQLKANSSEPVYYIVEE